MKDNPRNNVHKVLKCMEKKKVKIAKRMLRYKGIMPFSQELADWLAEYEREEVRAKHRDRTNSAIKTFGKHAENNQAILNRERISKSVKTYDIEPKNSIKGVFSIPMGGMNKKR